MWVNLISTSQLEEGGFDIKIMKRPYQFIITSPNRARCIASYWTNEVYILEPQEINYSTAKAYAVDRLPGDDDSPEHIQVKTDALSGSGTSIN